MNMKHRRKKITRIMPIEVGDRTSYEVEVNGRWRITWGTPVTIHGFDFFLVPIQSAGGVVVQAYSLDSLKLFESQLISNESVATECATEEGFIRTVSPLLVKINEALIKPKSKDFWKKIFYNEHLAAIIECGARNDKEQQLLKDFEKEQEDSAQKERH